MSKPLRHTSPSAGVPPGWGYRCAGRYRYGFNGIEEESIGEQSIDYYITPNRALDVRLARWLSCDPIYSQRRSWSPYNQLRNCPIQNCDPSGALDWEPTGNFGISMIMVSDAHDNFLTLNYFVEVQLGIPVNWDMSQWNNGNYQGEGIHKNELWNIYIQCGGNPAGSSMAQGEMGVPISLVMQYVNDDQGSGAKRSTPDPRGVFELIWDDEDLGLEYLFTSQEIDGANTGGDEWGGEEGLVKFSNSIDDIGNTLEYTIAFAPLGKVVSLFSMAIDQSLDFKNLDSETAFGNLFIRVGSELMSIGFSKIIGPPIQGEEVNHYLGEAVGNIAIDHFEEEAIKTNSE